MLRIPDHRNPERKKKLPTALVIRSMYFAERIVDNDTGATAERPSKLQSQQCMQYQRASKNRLTLKKIPWKNPYRILIADQTDIEKQKFKSEQQYRAFTTHTHLQLLHPNTTPTMFFPMSWTSPLTVAIITVPVNRDYTKHEFHKNDAHHASVILLSTSSMNGPGTTRKNDLVVYTTP